MRGREVVGRRLGRLAPLAGRRGRRIGPTDPIAGTGNEPADEQVGGKGQDDPGDVGRADLDEELGRSQLVGQVEHDEGSGEPRDQSNRGGEKRSDPEARDHGVTT